MYPMSNRRHSNFNSSFGNQYLGEFPKPSEEDLAARELALEYHKRTESYDRSVCSLRDARGIAMPADGYERGFINANARKVYRDVIDKAQLQEIPRHKLLAAISVIGREIDRGCTLV